MKRSKQEDVAIPITPMLDMAFQLLTFFILTYKPAPSEGQFSMNLLPSQAVATAESPAADSKAQNNDLPAGLKILPTILRADGAGRLGAISVGGTEVEGIEGFAKEVKNILNDPTLGFDQTVIKADPRLKWSEVVKVVNVFLSAPKKMKNISFDELGPNDGG